MQSICALDKNNDLWNAGGARNEPEGTAAAGMEAETIRSNDAFRVVIQSDPKLSSMRVGKPAKL